LRCSLYCSYQCYAVFKVRVLRSAQLCYINTG
jgi:hypothetical protein